LLNTSSFLDVNEPNLISVSSLLSALTHVPEEVSESCLQTTLKVLSQASVDVSQITENSAGVTLVQGLSNAITVEIQYGSTVSSSSVLRSSLDDVGYALTGNMVSGEDEIVVVTPNIRTSVLHPYLTDVENATLSPPQTTAEAAAGTAVPTFTFPKTGVASCGFDGYSVGTVTTQYGRNPYNISSLSSILRQSVVPLSKTNATSIDRSENVTIVLQNEVAVRHLTATAECIS
jgi:hypothetical protein